MIPVIEIVLSLRYELGDMQGLNISDHELIKPINSAVSLLYGTLSERFVHAAVKRLPIVVDETKTYSLPSDFVRIHQLVEDGGELAPTSINPPKECAYRVVGTELFANEGVYTLEYYYIPLRVTKLDDDLDVPLSMSTYIEQISLAMYNRDLALARALATQAQQFLSDNEVSHLENNTPTKIIGGRI